MKMFKFLSPTVPISRSFFLIPRFAGKLVGCWPDSQRSWVDVIVFSLSGLLMLTAAVGEHLYGLVYRLDVQNALEAFSPGITKAVCMLKLVLFFIYPKSYYRTIQKLKYMLTNETSKGKSKEIQKLAALASLLSFLLLFFGCATTTFFCLSPLITATYSLWKGIDFDLELPFKILLPRIFNEMPLFPLTYLGLTLSAIMTPLTFSTVDGFFVCACMYISTIFGILQQDIRDLFSHLKSCELASFSQNKKFHHELSSIVIRHNAIIDLCSSFTRQFTVIIMMHFLSAAMVLCLSNLNLMLQFGSINMFIYVFYGFAASTQLYLYCSGGDRVSESSLEVATTLYDIDWYKCDTRTKKMILMMLRRSQKTTRISVPFFTPSLSVFSSILSTAGSYITLLQTFL